MASDKDIPASVLSLSDAERKLLDNASPADREFRLQDLRQQLTHLSNESASNDLQRATIKLEIAGLQLDLDLRDDAWQNARSVVEVFIQHNEFEDAALACQYIYPVSYTHLTLPTICSV